MEVAHTLPPLPAELAGVTLRREGSTPGVYRDYSCDLPDVRVVGQAAAAAAPHPYEAMAARWRSSAPAARGPAPLRPLAREPLRVADRKGPPTPDELLAAAASRAEEQAIWALEDANGGPPAEPRLLGAPLPVEHEADGSLATRCPLADYDMSGRVGTMAPYTGEPCRRFNFNFPHEARSCPLYEGGGHRCFYCGGRHGAYSCTSGGRHLVATFRRATSAST